MLVSHSHPLPYLSVRPLRFRSLAGGLGPTAKADIGKGQLWHRKWENDSGSLLLAEQIKSKLGWLRQRRFGRKKHPDSTRRDSAYAPRHEDADLERTGRFFGGLRKELAARLPLYASDFRSRFARPRLAAYFI